MIRRMIMGMRIRRFSCSQISRIFKGSVIAPFLMSRLYCCVIYARIYLDIYALIYIIKLFMRQIYALILRRQHPAGELRNSRKFRRQKQRGKTQEKMTVL